MEQVNKLARFRTIKKCLEAIKEIDPDTAITEWYIRQLCKDGKIFCNGSGNKSLVCLDSLLEFLNRGFEVTLKERTSKEIENE